jgi:hypothetical protein
MRSEDKLITQMKSEFDQCMFSKKRKSVRGIGFATEIYFFPVAAQ